MCSDTDRPTLSCKSAQGSVELQDLLRIPRDLDSLARFGSDLSKPPMALISTAPCGTAPPENGNDIRPQSSHFTVERVPWRATIARSWLAADVPRDGIEGPHLRATQASLWKTSRSCPPAHGYVTTVRCGQVLPSPDARRITRAWTWASARMGPRWKEQYGASTAKFLLWAFASFPAGIPSVLSATTRPTGSKRSLAQEPKAA